jgi:hypothetical protein
MFLLLESKDEIAKAQRKLEATIRREFKARATKNIGYPGGTTSDAKVCTDGRHWFWSKNHRTKGAPNPRRLNWFGLFRADADLQISVEINTPYKERNNRIGGYFGRDTDTGAIYLFHSGRAGGSKKGVGKEAFLAWSNEALTEAVDSGGGLRKGVLVMPIEGKAATRPAIRYIDEIARFKQALQLGMPGKAAFQQKQKEYRDFYSEPRGRRKGKRSAQIDYISRHGDILDALEIWRNKQPFEKGTRIVKNVHLDMGLVVGRERRLVEAYEIKPSAARSDVYQAIGQLMVHGTSEQCQRTIVLPQKEPIASDLADALKRMGIRQLKFKLDEMKAKII